MTTDTRAWRVGAHYGIHGYAQNPYLVEDEPIFTAHRPDIAKQIVGDHNRAQFKADPTDFVTVMLERNKELADAHKELRRKLEMIANAITAILDEVPCGPSKVQDGCDQSPVEVGCE